MHLMIDLETLGTDPIAVITQFGWAHFDPMGQGMVASGLIHLDPEEQFDRGRRASWSTIMWWLTQSDEARAAMVTAQRSPFSALQETLATWDWSQIEGVWGHGSTFDVTLMEDLYASFHTRAPWGFRTPRDTRTLFSLRPEVEMESYGVAHNAEHDAIRQALHVQKITQMLVAP